MVYDGTNTTPSYLLLPEKRKRKDVLTEHDVSLITKACLENSEESPNKSYFIKKKNLETGGQTQHHYQKMLCQSGRYCKIFRGEFSCSIPQSCEKPFYVQKGKCDNCMCVCDRQNLYCMTYLIYENLFESINELPNETNSRDRWK